MAFDVKKLRNLFVQTTSEQQTQANPTTVETEESKAVKTTTTVQTELDLKIVDSLMKAILEHNLPGEDYLEFLEALKAMENIPLEDSMKVQTVLATLSTKGLTAAKIKESAEYYKKILANEQVQFSTELNLQIDKTVKSKEKTIEGLKSAIKQKTEQITLLSKEINEAQQNIGSTEVLIRAAESKINTTQENFNKAYNHVLNQINANLSKIK